MAMLEKAKESEKDKKKKHKHPAAKASEAQQPEGEGGDSEADAEAQQPDSDAGDSEPQAQGDSAGAGGGAPQDPQDQGGQSDQGSTGGAPDQQQGQQGPAPVPSPAAPGAGDTTSGGDDTPDADGDQDGDTDPNAQPPETPGENTSAGAGSNADLQQVPMPPGLKDKYKEANDLLMQLLYRAGDDKLAQGLVQGLMPQGPGKIKNTIVLCVQVVTQIHKRMQLPAPIILPFAKDVVAHVLDLGQQVKSIQYSDQECTAILGAVYEGCLRVFGVNRGNVKHVANHLGKSVLQAHQQKYLAAHASAKGAIDKNNQDFHHPHLAPQQGAPQEAGPQTGAPAGTQGATQSGAPPQPPPPPSPPGQGMLGQAAQQGEQSNG